MELPIHLKSLEPLTGALDILRYLNRQPDFSGSVSEMQDVLGIGPVTFGKAIRRLVTKSYVQMDSDDSYRLTDGGRRIAEELADYDAASGGVSRQRDDSDLLVSGRLVLVAPRFLAAGQPVELAVGASVDQAEGLPEGADVLVRVQAVHADPARPQDVSLMVADAPQYGTVHLTAQYYDMVRVRVEVYQVMPDGEEVVPCGGMYVDLPVSVQATQSSERAAYGAALSFRKTA
ncbi:MAG: hypothetical protein MUC99_03260 [Anaerolineae bacterium]|jgi:DNA-binding MarR family transcriptional regulator|nr:hypothetical protein [Anaerolineae bacterium]